MEWIDTLVRENVLDQKAIYVGRCNPLFLSYLMNTGSIFHAGTLTKSDRHKWTIWRLWDQAPKAQREAAAEPGTALALPSLGLAVASKDRVALQPSTECLELKSVRHHPNHSNVCHSEPEHPESDSALVSPKQFQKQEKWCNFTGWVFPTAGSDIVTKMFENEHCNS